MTPSGVSDPANADATALIVPSPPAATTASAPDRAADAAALVESAGVPQATISTVVPGSPPA
jgi:hypothetical protein